MQINLITALIILQPILLLLGACAFFFLGWRKNKNETLMLKQRIGTMVAESKAVVQQTLDTEDTTVSLSEYFDKALADTAEKYKSILPNSESVNLNAQGSNQLQTIALRHIFLQAEKVFLNEGQESSEDDEKESNDEINEHAEMVDSSDWGRFADGLMPILEAYMRESDLEVEAEEEESPEQENETEQAEEVVDDLRKTANELHKLKSMNTDQTELINKLSMQLEKIKKGEISEEYIIEQEKNIASLQQIITDSGAAVTVLEDKLEMAGKNIERLKRKMHRKSNRDDESSDGAVGETAANIANESKEMLQCITILEGENKTLQTRVAELEQQLGISEE